eukprot:4068575-Amphidinium_carterae.1
MGCSVSGFQAQLIQSTAPLDPMCEASHVHQSEDHPSLHPFSGVAKVVPPALPGDVKLQPTRHASSTAR